MRKIGIPVLLLLALGGCSATNLLGPSSPPPRLYTIAAPRQVAVSAPEVKWQLLVDLPHAPLDLDSSRIANSPSADRIDYYADVAWIDRAPALLQALIVESFDRSGRIAAVQRQGGGLRSDFVLASDLRDFEVDDASSPRAVRVRIAAKLIRMRDRSIVASRTFETAAHVAGGSFDSVIDAFGVATAELLPQIVDWTLTEGNRNQ